jgi:hypothetical protein
MLHGTLSRAASLTGESVRNYHKQGYHVVRGLFSQSDIQDALHEADELFQRRDLIFSENIRCRWQPNVTTQECLLSQRPPRECRAK